MPERHDSIITLPGGVTSYIDTLKAALTYVESNSPTQEEFVEWVIDSFSNMQSEQSARDKGRELERMGVLETDDGDRYHLTTLGEQLQETDPAADPARFFNALADHYIGFETILQALAQGPQTIGNLRLILNAVHDKEWDSIYQAEYRINWLRSLGLVDKDGDKASLTAVGEEITIDHPQINVEDILSESIEAPTDGPDPQSNIPIDAFGDDVSYYWINQSNETEREHSYLRSQDTYYTRDLTKLEVGDVLAHYWEGAVRAYSVVTTAAYEVSGDELEGATDEETYWRVDVDLHELDPVRDYEEIAPNLRRDHIRQGKEKYAINSAGIQSWYLCNLTRPGMQYLLETYPNLPDETGPEERRYFWVTANPTIWQPESIAGEDADSNEIFYTAINEHGNRKQIYDAFQRARSGDAVVFYESTPTKEIVSLGTVTAGLQENDDGVPGITIEHDRTVSGIEWADITAVEDLSDAAPVRNNAQGSLFELDADEYQTILALEAETPPTRAIETIRERLTLPPVPVSMPDELHFEDESRIQHEIKAALAAGKHIIFTGPPGTGKTKLAKHVSESATDLDAVDDYRFTTATADWTAYDTIGGYVPTHAEQGQELTFEPRLFLQCFRDPTGIKNEWLVIDELNRADIDKAMGQLFSVLSGDSTELPYERDATVEVRSLTADVEDDTLEGILANPDIFPVTPAWRLLATMNTYDKASLYELSYAFMRRFAFVRVGVPPLVDGEGTIRTDLLDPAAGPNFATVWISQSPSLEEPLNSWGADLAQVWAEVNDQRAIGPAIVHDMVRFLAHYDRSASNEEALTSAIVTHVYPQLEGLRQEKQRTIINGISSRGTPVDEDRLWQQAADFLGVPDTREDE